MRTATGKVLLGCAAVLGWFWDVGLDGCRTQCRGQDDAASNVDVDAENVTAGHTEQLLRAAQEALEENRRQLKSAFGTGSVTFRLHEAGEREAIALLDADVQFFHQAPKFRIHMVYSQRLVENKVGETGEAKKRWVPSKVSEHVILFDGERLHSVEFFEPGKCRGTTYFGYAKVGVLRSAGFPFSDPVDLSEGALDLQDLRPLSEVRLTPFGRGGFMGQQSKNTYNIKFFFFGDFGYDLRRVSSYRNGETQPFRDYLISWGESNGVRYVRRFAHTVTSAHGNTGSSAQTAKKWTVEYHTFEANVPINPSVFALESVGIPEGTLFLDRRANVEGGPKKLVFGSQGLSPWSEAQAAAAGR